MTTTPRKPAFILKHDVRGDDGKTVRAVRVGAMWAPDGNRPGRIRLDYLPIGFDGYLTAWPNDPKEE
jgi:hypothetical protein